LVKCIILVFLGVLTIGIENNYILQVTTITGSSFAAGCLRNLLPGSAPIFLQWFKLVLIIQQ